jgi:hypothetical protein
MWYPMKPFDHGKKKTLLLSDGHPDAGTENPHLPGKPLNNDPSSCLSQLGK